MNERQLRQASVIVDLSWLSIYDSRERIVFQTNVTFSITSYQTNCIVQRGNHKIQQQETEIYLRLFFRRNMHTIP